MDYRGPRTYRQDPGPVTSTRGLTTQGGDERAGPGPEQGVGGQGERALLQVRAAEQTSSRVVWDSQAGRAAPSGVLNVAYSTLVVATLPVPATVGEVDGA